MKISESEAQWVETVGALCGIPLNMKLETQGLFQLMSPNQLEGLSALVQKLSFHLRQGNPLIVVGDYDADGIFSTALMVEALKALGAQKVIPVIPDRMEDGYGLSISVLKRLDPELQPPGAIITVDNGIRAFEAVDFAREAGWEVLLTDHHMPGERLPQADALVNPKACPAGAHPAGAHPADVELAGVGVAFFVAVGLFQNLKQLGFDVASVDPREWLNGVALGTLADMVPLDLQNRLLVRHGLMRIKLGRMNPGLRALLDCIGYGPGQKPYHLLTVRELGFKLNPMINAAGRLNQPEKALSCLLARDEDQAKLAALELQKLNEKRRALQAKMREDAGYQMKKNALSSAPYLILASNDWPLGLLGVLASQLKERYNKSVFIFGKGLNQQWRGSARSVQGVNLSHWLQSIHQSFPDLISHFGGHQQAAGLTLRDDVALQAFKNACEVWSANQPGGGFPEQQAPLLIPMDSEQLSLRTLQLLDYWLCGQLEQRSALLKSFFWLQESLPMRQCLGYRWMLCPGPCEPSLTEVVEGLWFGGSTRREPTRREPTRREPARQVELPKRGDKLELHYQLRVGYAPDFPLKLQIVDWRPALEDDGA